ncbi:DUF2071 domain-containing protein [Micromonospora polyrhachis]|uniref:DUF2071 domain-containing protein n=1 Tax=Micromonospora polyrhachis TaxID=1282883 RepID=A0A7W7WRR4_9ACTN|nr:DUF2071 domain-containing protein [Micromonospora polyrhachis]MBB4960857.1 hypothetical protein [Micromonospora polyrhachis]
MSVEPVTTGPPRPIRPALLGQRWDHLAFLHWPVEPETVQPFLPAGTRPDTVDGISYVGLIAFRMVGVGLPVGPGLPYLGTFAETNVRLYSVDDEGRRGVVFRSLDAARLPFVLAAQAGLRLPYKWSAMRLDRAGDRYTYRCRRRWPNGRGATSRLEIRAGARIGEPTPLEHFLTARWGLHVRAYGRTLYLPNEHPPWPLHQAELLELDDQLVSTAGLPSPPGPPVSVLFSPGVPVRFGRPVPLAEAQ